MWLLAYLRPFGPIYLELYPKRKPNKSSTSEISFI
jgi:hypothetical protein